MTNINFNQFRDAFGNIIQEFEVIEFRKNSNGDWIKAETIQSGSTYFNVDGKLFYKSGSTSFEMNTDFNDKNCGACFAIGNPIENNRKITGNFVLGEYSLFKKSYTLNKQTYANGTCHYTVKDEYGNSRVEHSSGNPSDLIEQMNKEIKIYSNNIEDYNKEACELKIAMNKDIIQVLENEMKLVA